VSEWDEQATRLIDKGGALFSPADLLERIRRSPIEKVEEFKTAWAGLLPAAECALFLNDKKASEALQHPHAPLWLLTVMITLANSRRLYDKLKAHYEDRGKKLDRLAADQSRLLAENHTLRIELRDAREATALIQRSRTVTK
jgi:hypothetical protein